MPTNFSKVDKLVDQAMRQGLQNLGNDVRKRSIVLAPVLTGELRRSARVDVKGDSVAISFNTPYSRIRHEVNYAHPSTKKYLYNGLKSITSIDRYFPTLF